MIDEYISHKAYARAYRRAERTLRIQHKVEFEEYLIKELVTEPDYVPKKKVSRLALGSEGSHP